MLLGWLKVRRKFAEQRKQMVLEDVEPTSSYILVSRSHGPDPFLPPIFRVVQEPDVIKKMWLYGREEAVWLRESNESYVSVLTPAKP